MFYKVVVSRIAEQNKTNRPKTRKLMDVQLKYRETSQINPKEEEEKSTSLPILGPGRSPEIQIHMSSFLFRPTTRPVLCCGPRGLRTPWCTWVSCSAPGPQSKRSIAASGEVESSGVLRKTLEVQEHA